MSVERRDLHAVERSIAAVEAIDQVVGAVWTLARAQQRHVESAAVEVAAYLGWVEELLARFAEERFEEATDEEAKDEVLWVVLGPERPFCGGLARRIVEQLPPAGDLLIVGRRLGEAVPLSGSVHERIVARLPAAAAPDEIDSCARRIAAELLSLDSTDRIGLLHPTEGGTRLVQTTLVSATPRVFEDPPETYSPSPTVLAATLQEAMAGRLIVGSAEALRSEVRARLMSAEAARQGCERMLEELRQEWRVQRQESITTELLELYSGRLKERSGLARRGSISRPASS